MRKKKRGIKSNRRILLRIAEGQNWKCAYCGFPMFDEHEDLQYVSAMMQVPVDTIKKYLMVSREHVIERKYGKRSLDKNNLVAAHTYCNNTRSKWETYLSQVKNYDKYHEFVNKRVHKKRWVVCRFFDRSGLNV